MLRAFPREVDKNGMGQRKNKNDVKTIQQEHEGSPRRCEPEKREADGVNKREWQIEDHRDRLTKHPLPACEIRQYFGVPVTPADADDAVESCRLDDCDDKSNAKNAEATQAQPPKNPHQ